MNLLEIKNVSKQYSNHLALNDVSLNLPEKSIMGLLGPNGAGKTSLIRIINQITAPDSGEIYFKGEKLQKKHVARIGYLPEERGLYKKMRIGEQITYLARLKGLSKNDANARIKYWFEKFEIESWWKKKVEELSKGMQQKIQFISTVIHDPELLILDEPFSGFDPINAELIKNEILELRAKGTTVIFSTHRMESVEEMCDYITLIHKSNKILEGSTKQIKTDFKTNKYQVDFIGNLPQLGLEIENLEAGEINESRILVTLPPGQSANSLLQSLIPQVEIVAFKELIPSVNEIFIKAVNQ